VVDRSETPQTRAGAPRIESIAPNPSSGAVVIRVGGAALDRAAVYDLRGRRVRNLAAADGELNWDGNDDTGRRMASGVYFVRVSNPAGFSVRRVVRVPSR